MLKIVSYSKSFPGHTLAWLFTSVFCVSALAGPPKPQIPKEDFEWNGSFIGNAGDLSAPQVEYDLTVSGKWQNGHFNLYMEQGSKYDDTWVENLIFEGKLYSITRKWHIDDPKINDLLGKCFQTMVYNKEDPYAPEHITVDDFNRGLKNGSRLVGREKIGGKPVNHFRHSCLSQSALQLPFVAPPIDPDNPPDKYSDLSIPFNVFSDIYVSTKHPYPWKKWLQYGDGVGPDPQNDEWFEAEKTNRKPDNIILPDECQIWNLYDTLFLVQQTTCKNLVENEEPED